MIDRKPPSDTEAEKAVLGSIIALPRVLDEIPWLHPGDFLDAEHGTLYAVLREIHDNGKPAGDAALIVAALKKAKAWGSTGAAWLSSIINAVPNGAHGEYHAAEVRRCSTLRKLIEAGSDIVSDAYSPDADPAEQLSRAEAAVYAIQDRRAASRTTPVKNILADAMERMEARQRGDVLEGSVLTGFTDLDAMLGGLRGSELIILAARPGLGKTACAMNIAEHVAIDQQLPVLFVSLEMSSMELGDRLLCSVARVNSHRLRNGTISGEDRRSLVEKAGFISEAPLHIDDSPSMRMSEIASSARRVSRRGGLSLIVVDYLQLIEPDNSRDVRQEQVAKIARRLKGLAREMNVPVLCLAQLNRQTESSKDNEPKLSHLRESGAIEQDADVVMFVHRPEYFVNGDAKQAVEGQAKILVRKQRNGPTGDVDLIWRKEFTRFENPAAQDMDNYVDEFAAYNNEPEPREFF